MSSPARLILLNGPPGIGKSTIARRYVAEHALAFCLDIDGIRRLIGGWQEHPAQSGALARRMALAMAAEHLGGGHDVVVPQYLGRPAFLGELERLAAATGSTFAELVLLDDRAEAVARFDARSADPERRTHHREAAAMLAGDGGLEEMYDRLVALLGDRPRAQAVWTTAGDVEGAYRDVLAAVARAASSAR